MKVLHLAALLTLLTVSIASAQTASGVISGRIADSSDMAVAQANVTLSYDETGDARQGRVDASGDFVFPGLLPGRYTITVQAAGFKKVEMKSVNLAASERLSVGKLVLEIGAVVETVTVAAQVTPVEVENSDRSGLVTSEQMQRGLTRNRNLLGLVAMLPGAVLDDTGNILEGDNTGTAPTPSFGGIGNSFNTVTVDGVNAAGSNTQYFNASVTMEAVEEVKVLANNFKAEYGRSGGAMIMAVTRTGSNKFRGSAFYYMRNEAFNANSAWSNYLNSPRPKYRYNTFGGSFSGPVNVGRLKNKLFFSFSEEAQPRTLPQPIVQFTMPSALERAGDFSKTVDTNGKLISIQDPLNNKTPFPGNTIPQAQISKSGQNLLNLFPVPNFFDTTISKHTFNYRYQESPTMKWHQEVIRLDYNATNKLRVYGRGYTGFQPQQGYFAGAQAQPWPFLANRVDWQNPSGSIGGTYTASPSVVIEFSAGFQYQMIKVYPLADEGYDAVNRQKLGIDIQQMYPAKNPNQVLPNASFGGVSLAPGIGVRGDFPDSYFGPRSTANGSISKLKGSHTLKAGLFIEKHRYFRESTVNFNGTLDFSNDSNSSLNTNYAYSNALTGTFTKYTESDSRPQADLRSTVLQWYGQDTWKVTRRLTLDIGARFSWAVPYHPANMTGMNWQQDSWNQSKEVTLYVPGTVGGKSVAVDPRNGNTVARALSTAVIPGSGDARNGMVKQAGLPTGFIDPKGVQLAPRFGFAWDVLGDGKTAIRGGIGYTVTPNPNVGFTGVQSMVTNLTTTPSFFYGTLNSINPNAAGVVFPNAVTFLSPALKLPSVINYSFSIQRAVGFKTVVEAAYVASLGRGIPQNQNLNTLAPGERFLASSRNPYDGNKLLADTFLYPYQGYAGLTQSRTSTSNYQSMQLQANRRFSDGLQFGAAWTWGKTLGFVGNFPVYLDNHLNHAKTGLNRDHTLSVNWLYDVPKASKLWDNFVVRALGNGWQMSGIAHFQTGKSLAVTFARSDGLDTTGGGDWNNRPLVLSNPNLPRGERTFDRYFDTKAFGMPMSGIGFAPMDAITGPGKNNFDLSAYKNFKVKERATMQFRWELYNAFNHPSWSGVNTSARFDAAGNQINATFGQVTGSTPGRIMQGVLRLTF